VSKIEFQHKLDVPGPLRVRNLAKRWSQARCGRIVDRRVREIDELRSKFNPLFIVNREFLLETDIRGV